MKTTITLLAISLVATLGLSAEDTNTTKKPPRNLPAEMIEKFDSNQDGTLDESERQAAREAMREIRKKRRAEMLEKYDSDNDGKLSKDERKAMLLDRFDADGDGVLNDSEKQNAKEAARRMRGFRTGGRERGGPRAEKKEKDNTTE